MLRTMLNDAGCDAVRYPPQRLSDLLITAAYFLPLDINFSTGLGRLTLPSIPIISPVIRMLSAQLIAVRMTGTLEAPVVEILPIAPITRPVKGVVDTVIRPGKQDNKKK